MFLTEKQVKSRASAQSFSRGQSYYRQGAIYDTIRRGDVLEGYCEGSQYTPYRIRVMLEKDKIVSVSCSCPYDWGGDCKHIIALLLTYVNKPEKFTVKPPVDQSLKERTKDELIGLIQKMLQRYPDLQTLVDHPIPRKRETPVSVDSYKRTLHRGMNEYGEWGDSPAADAIESVRLAADDFAANGGWKNAGLIYRTIMEESRDSDYDFIYNDHDGEVFFAIDEVVSGLESCLKQDAIIKDKSERQANLQSLLYGFIIEVEIGGMDFAHESTDIVLRYVKAEDVPVLYEQIEAAKKKKDSQWGRETYERFLDKLDTFSNVDPEETLKRLREQGLYALLMQKLLELKRMDEALKVVEEHMVEPYARLSGVMALNAVGQGDAAIRLAKKALVEGYDDRLAGWLISRYDERGEREAHFQLQLRRMKSNPSVPYYGELKAASEEMGNWQNVRQEVLKQFQDDREYELITRIYLHDEEWDAAWELLPKAMTEKNMHGYLISNRLDLDVAHASRHARPTKAIPVFVKYARAAIKGKNRNSYARAASHLAIVKELYHQIDDEATWERLIADLREGFKKLPALKDELNKAGL